MSTANSARNRKPVSVQAAHAESLEWPSEIAQGVVRARAILDLMCQLDETQMQMTYPDTPEKALEAARDELIAVEKALRRFDESHRKVPETK